MAQKLGGRMPDFGRQLEDAGIKEGAVEYLSFSLMLASACALSAFAGTAAVFIFAGKPAPALSLALALFSFAFVLGVRIARPHQLMKSKATGIEGCLVFSLHALNIELEAGIRFNEALKDVASKDYGEFSKEMRKVLDEADKHGLSEALAESARRIPSKSYRKAVWQMVNSLETGADVNSSIKSVIEELRGKQEDDARRYGKSMEKQLMFYIMGGLVFPALSVAIAQTASSVGFSASAIGESAYWSILAFSIGVQLLFLYMIRFSKPALLREIREPRKPANPVLQLKAALEYAGVRMPWQQYIVNTILFSLSFGIFAALMSEPYLHVGYPPLILSGSILAAIALTSHLLHKAEDRGHKAAEYLPDSLRLMAANMEAGVSTDQALLMSAKPEYGVLGEELGRMGQDMMKNHTLEEALENLKKRVKSDALHMSVSLVGHGLKAGSGLSKSLSHIASVLDGRERVRGEVASALQSVKTMVVVVVVFSAPLLHGCSGASATITGHLREKVSSDLPAHTLAQNFMERQGGGVSDEFIQGYIITNLAVTAVLGSMIVGELGSMRKLSGLRYTLWMTLASVAVYVAVKSFLAEKIGGAFV